MPDPCACGGTVPHAEIADWVSPLLRDRDALVRQLALVPIGEVYRQFKHLDALLSDPAAEPEDPIGRTCWALWAAVKRAMENADA